MERIDIGSPVSIAGVTLIPVSRIMCWSAKRGTSFFGAKHPVAVIVVSPSGKRAFKLTGEEVPLEELVRKLPSIRKLVEEIIGR